MAAQAPASRSPPVAISTERFPSGSSGFRRSRAHLGQPSSRQSQTDQAKVHTEPEQEVLV